MEGAKDSAGGFPSLPGSAPRVRLSVIRGPGEGAAVELHRVLALIGSRERCKICLRHRGVAPVHCAIVNTGYEVFLRDLITEGKTYLNDLPVECERLNDGDVIRVAQWEFALTIAAPPGGEAAAPINLEPARTVTFQAANNGRLTKLRCEVGVIGRIPGCDVLLQHSQVSRAHALIASHMGQPAVFDLLSTHGMTLNGQPAVFAPIHSGDVLDLGTTALRVVIPQGPARAAAQDPADTDLETTVIRLDDREDKVDIRAAELDLDRKS
jgi:pSer/pThr/pTyr-binding forkhead associated (FHA) protein